ncbi:MAG: choice-of-anchor L domain-containing protein [Bacteroidales bacterium]|nr:choice-of-anchor L domain-containing protein [Bacteroidales bacterium]
MKAFTIIISLLLVLTITYGQQLPGNNVNSPIVVESVPFTFQGSNCGYENIYSMENSVCKNRYINGSEMVFSFLPENNITLQFNIISQQSEMAINITKGLPDKGEFIACINNTAVISFEANSTYFFIASNFDTNSCIEDFEIAINETYSSEEVIPSYNQLRNLLVVDNTTYTPTQLVQDILITGCLEAFNVNYTGDITAIGYFSAENTPLGFNEGIILASGSVSNAIGPNNIGSAGNNCLTPGDANLNAICSLTTYDAAILEFDFIPQDNTLAFNFIFGSEEYPEFIDAGFNDVFAFFLTGGPEGYNNQNIALIPGSGGVPVAIDNLNAGNPVGSACDYCAYYIDNGTGLNPTVNTDLQYDGLTTSLTATASVTACQTYHIKIAIADAGDGVYDSGVFLQAGSFASGDGVEVDLADINGESFVTEGCDYVLTFGRQDPSNITDPVNITYSVAGTASSGADYQTLSGSATILSGQASVSITIPTYSDLIAEGSETIIVSITNAICPCGGTTTVSDTITIIDNLFNAQIVNPDMSICTSTSISLTTEILVSSSEPYTYLWSSGATTSGINVSPTSSTTYTVTITDACGKQVVDDFNVSIEPLAIEIDGTNVTCANGDNGYAEVTPITGSPTFSYNWLPAVSSSNIAENLSEGTYSVTVTDALSCSASASITITEPEAITIELSSTPEECGACDGTATVSLVNNGTLPYTYHWSDNQNTATASNLCSGSIFVTVTDANGCTATSSISVSSSGSVEAGFSDNGPQCFNGNSFHFTNIGASGIDYSYYWDFGDESGTSNIENPDYTYSSPGEYIVTQTIMVGECEDSYSSTIIVNTHPNVNIIGTNPSCSEYCDGTALTSVTGSGTVFSYLWSNSQTSNPALNLCEGEYSVIVSDENGCTATNTVTLTEPQALSVFLTTQNELCYESCDGSISATGEGGTGTFSFQWSNGQLDANAINLCSGNYSVSMTDANGCQAIQLATISGPEAIQIEVSEVIPSECNNSNGSILVSASGGTPAYTYLWSPVGGTNEELTDISTGNYTILVSDLNSCEESITVFVPEIGGPDNLIFVSQDPSCYGFSDGYATAAASGGTSPYTYQWSNLSVGNTAENLSAEIEYYVTAYDSNNCTISASVTLEEPNQLTVQILGDSISCPSQPVNLSAIGLGGTTPYVLYDWDSLVNSSNYIVYPENQTTYWVTIYDSNNCTASSGFTIDVYPPLNISVSISDSIICPGEQVYITGIVNGGNGSSPIIYNNGTVVNFPFVVSPNISTNYNLLADDGCVNPAIDSTFVTVISPPLVNISADKLSGCVPLTVNFSSFGSGSTISYNWNLGLSGDDYFSPNPEFEYNNPGYYDVSLSLISPEGCENSLLIENMISVHPNPDAGFIAQPPAASIFNPVINFYQIDYSTNSIYWSFGDGNNSSLYEPSHTYSAPGSYYVSQVVTNEYGCTDTTGLYVFINEEYSFYAPTAITTLDGRNDVFYPVGTGIDPENFLMIIYDRWGEAIYETDKYDPENPRIYGWNGTVKGRNPSKTGTYTWLVICRDSSGIQHEHAGAVTVIR